MNNFEEMKYLTSICSWHQALKKNDEDNIFPGRFYNGIMIIVPILQIEIIFV